jgi:TetR/AcrR family transcriptional regulator of autoinduction and epiphytic fitness
MDAMVTKLGKTRVRSDQVAGSKRLDNTGNILDAAKRLFLAKGFGGVNLDRVAQAANVSRQTLYNRFGSKEAIFRAMVERHWSIFDDQELFSSLSGSQLAEPGEILRRFARTTLRFISEREQVAFTRLVIAEARHLPWIAEDFYRLGKEPLLEAFAACLKRLSHEKKLKCPHPEIAARQFFGLINEFTVWPKVMAIGSAALKIPSDDVVIDEAIKMFLSRYGVLVKPSKA